ncbi:MAG: GYD domain-containing protein, partial [Desulforhopalus sp.]
IREECPEVEWVHNYAVMGPYDYVDIFQAPDIEMAFKVSTVIRTFGHAQTEIWSATEWSAYKELVRDLPQR